MFYCASGHKVFNTTNCNPFLELLFNLSNLYKALTKNTQQDLTLQKQNALTKSSGHQTAASSLFSCRESRYTSLFNLAPDITSSCSQTCSVLDWRSTLTCLYTWWYRCILQKYTIHIYCICNTCSLLLPHFGTLHSHSSCWAGVLSAVKNHRDDLQKSFSPKTIRQLTLKSVHISKQVKHLSQEQHFFCWQSWQVKWWDNYIFVAPVCLSITLHPAIILCLSVTLSVFY